MPLRTSCFVCNSIMFVVRINLIWFEFVVPAALLLWIGIFGILTRCNICQRALKYSVATFWVIFVMVFAQITMTLLKFLSCRPVDGEWFLLYAGHHECIGLSFYISLGGLGISILIPGLTYYYLFHQPNEVRLHPNLSALIASYNDQHWYVQFCFWLSVVLFWTADSLRVLRKFLEKKQAFL